MHKGIERENCEKCPLILEMSGSKISFVNEIRAMNNTCSAPRVNLITVRNCMCLFCAILKEEK